MQIFQDFFGLIDNPSISLATNVEYICIYSNDLYVHFILYHEKQTHILSEVCLKSENYNISHIHKGFYKNLDV